MQSQITRKKETYPIVTFFPTNPTWNGLPWDSPISMISEIESFLELNNK